ncbi:MAG: hypothetical protein ABSF17_06555 [Terracidiphilus sp.]|jgi:hypothetical protein
MDDSFDSLALLLSDVILPTLKSVQSHQAEQIAANDRVEQAIEDLRASIESQFGLLSSQLTACRIELQATQAALRAAQASNQVSQMKLIVH